MKVIYKYELAVIPKQFIKMPYDFKILKVDVQKGIPCIWVEHIKEIAEAGIHVLNSYEFITVGTGKPFSFVYEDNWEYIGSYMLDEGQFVGHVYLNRG
jgi:hypothetical protein